MAAKSKILVLGGTSYIGKFIVMASVEAGHPTFALVRESTLSHPEKSKLIQSFKSFGVTLLYAIKQVDVLIFMLGGQQIDDQVNVIAIKEAGNIKVIGLVYISLRPVNVIVVVLCLHCPYVLEAMTTLVELGSTAKDIISFIPQ
ncbi:Isoflavone reductase-like A622, partial [Glycine soja]